MCGVVCGCRYELQVDDSMVQSTLIFIFFNPMDTEVSIKRMYQETRHKVSSLLDGVKVLFPPPPFAPRLT